MLRFIIVPILIAFLVAWTWAVIEEFRKTRFAKNFSLSSILYVTMLICFFTVCLVKLYINQILPLIIKYW